MSYDLDTRLAPCDHFQIKERLVIDEDRQTLLYADNTFERMRAPISNTNLVKLFISGVQVNQDHPIYGWTIEDDELSIAPDRKKKIVFKQPQRIKNNLIEISYNTIVPYCRKCNGYGRTNDLKPNSKRSYMHITESDKLILRCYKFLLTSNCRFYPIFTSRLKDWIGRKFGLSITTEDVSLEAQRALSMLKRIQLTQKTVQILTPQEILREILNVNSVRSEEDPTYVRVKIDISSYGKNRPQSLQFSLKSTKQR